MKPTSGRDILRNRTAYAGGRLIAGVLLALIYLGAVLTIVLAVNTSLPPALSQEFALWLALAVGLVQSLVATVLWFVAMAIFDIADASLANLNIESAL
jgi:tetrahydromethanopterin S-methyltransferase subunit C